MSNEVRYKLIIGKFRVIKRDHKSFTLDMFNNQTLVIELPMPADVRLGDLLTVYTEILAHAQPGSTSKQ
jgi:hypothetical protein